LRDLGPSFEIGLHLNLTLGTPLTHMPKFVPTGTLPNIREVLRVAGAPSLPIPEIGAEITAQIDSFGAAFDRPPAFVDGHQHVHVLRGLRHVLFEVLERKGLVGRLWLRDSGDRPWRILRRGIQSRKALTIAWLARGFASDAAARGFATNDGFSGFSDFSDGRDYAADFDRYLIAPGASHLMMCHPGIVDAELERLDPVTRSRERELAFLLSPRFGDCLSRRGAHLAQMGATTAPA